MVKAHGFNGTIARARSPLLQPYSRHSIPFKEEGLAGLLVIHELAAYRHSITITDGVRLSSALFE